MVFLDVVTSGAVASIAVVVVAIVASALAGGVVATVAATATFTFSLVPRRQCN